MPTARSEFGGTRRRAMSANHATRGSRPEKVEAPRSAPLLLDACLLRLRHRGPDAETRDEDGEAGRRRYVDCADPVSARLL